jgi:LacI family repressor for deo operon, udp, cdd, tsx, nupC, and nupG
LVGNDSKEHTTDLVQGAVRLVDVAREAGVAIATASRALNNPDRVNAVTRARARSRRPTGLFHQYRGTQPAFGAVRFVLVIMPPRAGFNVLEPALTGLMPRFSARATA